MLVPDENVADPGGDAIEHALVRTLADWCHDRDVRGLRRTLLAIILKLDEVS